MSGRFEYKTHWITTTNAQELKKITVKEQVGVKKIKKRKSYFSQEEIEVEEPIFENKEKWVGTGKYLENRVDLSALSSGIEAICNEYGALGFDLVQVLGTIAGNYQYQVREALPALNQGAWAYGYGYSLSDGVILVFRREEK